MLEGAATCAPAPAAREWKGRAMAVYNLEIPLFVINQVRSRYNDTLFASTALKVRAAGDGLHHDWGSAGTALGDRPAGSVLTTGLMWAGVDVPDPTPQAPDGGAVCWTFTLMNAGHADNGFLPALNKLTDAFAGALADKAVDAAEAGNVGAAFTHFLQTVELIGVQEVVNLLTANCDGGVASGAFDLTAVDLANMTGPGNGVWKVTKNNPGYDSAAGCGGANSNYDVGYRISLEGRLTWSGEEDLGGSSPPSPPWRRGGSTGTIASIVARTTTCGTDAGMATTGAARRTGEASSPPAPQWPRAARTTWTASTAARTTTSGIAGGTARPGAGRRTSAATSPPTRRWPRGDSVGLMCSTAARTITSCTTSGTAGAGTARKTSAASSARARRRPRGDSIGSTSSTAAGTTTCCTAGSRFGDDGACRPGGGDPAAAS